MFDNQDLERPFNKAFLFSNNVSPSNGRLQIDMYVHISKGRRAVFVNNLSVPKCISLRANMLNVNTVTGQRTVEDTTPETAGAR